MKNKKTIKTIYQKKIRNREISFQETYIVPMDKSILNEKKLELAHNKCSVIEVIDEHINSKKIKKCAKLTKATKGENIFNQQFYPECEQSMLNWISINKQDEYPKYLDGCPNKCEYFEWPITRKIKKSFGKIYSVLANILSYIKKPIEEIIKKIISS